MAIEQSERYSGSTEGRRLMYVFNFTMAWGVWHPKLIPSCVSVEAPEHPIHRELCRTGQPLHHGPLAAPACDAIATQAPEDAHRNPLQPDTAQGGAVNSVPLSAKTHGGSGVHCC